MTTILRAVVGSKAYGLQHAESDTDRLGVFVAPTLSVSGLDWNSAKESRVQQGPDGDDECFHEAGKACKLLLKVNPTVTEMLWVSSDGYEVLTDEGQTLVDVRTAFLSRKAVWNSFRGYSYAQLKKYADGFTKIKYARHVLRLVEAGRGLYETGELSVRVQNPKRFFDLSDMTSKQVLGVLQAELDAWQETSSPLPEEPDRDTVRDFLASVRRNHLED